jgi:hypothetical protein
LQVVTLFCYFLTVMNKEHLSSRQIKDYLLDNLSTEQQIDAGIHIDKCRQCYLKAMSINEKIKFIEEQIDDLGDLPLLIEKVEKSKRVHLEQTDKNSLAIIIKKMLNRVDEIMRERLEALLTKLKDPAFELTPFKSLIDELGIETGALITKERSIRAKEKTITLVPGKELSVRKKAKDKIECRIESHAKDLPTIFYPSVENGFEIVDFKKLAGKNYFSAVIPQDVSDKHFLLHKTKNVKLPTKKK